MQKIVVFNPKGGSGKTTVATNLAACLAVAGRSPTLMDLDPQGSSMSWLSNRPERCARIHGIAAFERPSAVTLSWHRRVPESCDTLVVDTPAGLRPQRLPDILKEANAVLVPVMPSAIDIRAATRCIEDLLLVGRVRPDDGLIGIMANRVRRNTLIFPTLMRFLDSLRIPVVATLRDTQNYVRAAQLGMGIHEMPRWRVRQDLEQWDSLKEWLDGKV